MTEPSDLTRRIRKTLGETYQHGWEIPPGLCASPPAPERKMQITLLPPAMRYASGRVAISTWRIADERGELIFSMWLRRDHDLTLTCFRGSLGPGDFPEIFERSDDWWRVRSMELLPAIAGQHHASDAVSYVLDRYFTTPPARREE
jgi:hypothetical protein